MYLIPILLLLVSTQLFGQVEKVPNQAEMERMMREANQQIKEAMDEMSPEDKRMMDSLGIKMPDFKNTPKVSDKQLARAWENESRVVPKRDAARIAAITKGVTAARMETYVATIQKKMMATLDAGVIKMGDKIFSYIQSNSNNSAEAGNMAAAFWIIDKPQMAMYVLGKVITHDPANTDNLSNYAAMLSMQGAQHLAIPILNNLNVKFPNNSTLLNNLGQAWLGLGDLIKAEEYLNKALVLYPLHPQANMAKAAIAESKGNKEKAKEAIKKSMQHAYTQEKEEKLAKLGEKVSHTQYLLPPRRKIDVLNLDGFRSPFFPMSSVGCITAEIEWKAFYEQIDEKINSLSKLREDAEAAAMKGKERRMNENYAFNKAAKDNPGTGGQMLVVPMYAIRATKILKATMDLEQRKMEAFNSKQAFYTQELLQLKKAYDEEMQKLRREDDAQTGDHRANEDYCPKYRVVTDKFLKDINGKLQAQYLDALTLKKEMINESAHYVLYMLWPDEFQVAKYDYQIEWLNFLKKGFGAPAYVSGFPFVSITLNEYSCNNNFKEEPEFTKLQNFDDVHCEYHSKLDWEFMKISNDCSRMTTEIDLDFFKYVRKDDFERVEGDTYVSSTIKVSAKKKLGPDKEMGPVKIGAEAGVSVEIERDRKGTKEVTIIGKVEISAGTDVIDDNAPGKDNIERNITIGVEGRIGIISGQGTVSGTGVLSGVTIIEF
ncbi:MAG TPA: hypothetical protein PKY29_01205 [Ferruginibacter sp.]|nr:hypothetical protein [Ferruginibacter sp.]HRQ19897.1 hypothetical protein [Ferruginibacter sp.]